MLHGRGNFKAYDRLPFPANKNDNYLLNLELKCLVQGECGLWQLFHLTFF